MKDRVAIITGAAGGLGRAAAHALADDGHHVVAVDLSADRLEGVREEIGRKRCSTLTADSTSWEEVSQAVDNVVVEHGRVDVLLNAAGGSVGMMTGREDPPVLELSPEDWHMVIDVNLTGTFHWAKAVGSVMAEQESGGHIILLGSGTGVRPGPRHSAYAAAKGGVVQFARCMAREVGDQNVRVNVIHPGMTLHDQMRGAATDSHIEGYLRDAALSQLSDTDAFTSFVRQLQRMPAVSGQSFNIDSRIL